jgi:hypothetical protein
VLRVFGVFRVRWVFRVLGVRRVFRMLLVLGPLLAAPGEPGRAAKRMLLQFHRQMLGVRLSVAWSAPRFPPLIRVAKLERPLDSHQAGVSAKEGLAYPPAELFLAGWSYPAGMPSGLRLRTELSSMDPGW